MQTKRANFGLSGLRAASIMVAGCTIDGGGFGNISNRDLIGGGAGAMAAIIMGGGRRMFFRVLAPALHDGRNRRATAASRGGR